jgi:hypothetical protein
MNRDLASKHFKIDGSEFTCKDCGSTHSEYEAIIHLLREHGYTSIDIEVDD